MWVQVPSEFSGGEIPQFGDDQRQREEKKDALGRHAGSRAAAPRPSRDGPDECGVEVEDEPGCDAQAEGRRGDRGGRPEHECDRTDVQDECAAHIMWDPRGWRGIAGRRSNLREDHECTHCHVGYTYSRFPNKRTAIRCWCS